MICLLLAATPNEIKPIISFLKKEKSLPENFLIDILISGVGMMNTTYRLTKQIQLHRPDVIIQLGIGGSFDKKIALGDVVVIEKDCIGDLGVMEKNNFNTAFDLNLIKPNSFPFKNGWLENKNKDLLKQTDCKKVSAITVNEITTGKKKIELYRSKYAPTAESMEGAALHYVAAIENIPFVQLRGLSNYVGERNKTKWRMYEAIENVNTETIKLIKQIGLS